MSSAEKMPAYLWWDANGASCPELAAVRGASRPRPACLGLYLRAHQLGVRVHQGPAAQQAAARQGKQARGHLPQPPPPHTHEQAQLRGASRRMELRGQPRGCHQVRRRGLRAPQELHPNLSAEAARAPPTMAGGRAAAAPAGVLDQDGQPLMMLM